MELYNISEINVTVVDMANQTGVTDEMTGGILATDILGIWVTGVLCLLGFAGNILSFVVLWRAFSGSPMFLVLRAVAISDAIFLLTVFLIQTVVNMYPYINILQWCFTHRGYVQFYMWPILMMVQMSSVWLTVLVSMERYIAICYPFQAASTCTIPKVRKAVIIIYIGSIVFNIPRFFEFYVTPDGSNIDKTDIGRNVVYRYLYNCVLYSLMLFFIPLFCLVFLNIKLVLALRKGKKQWQSLQFRQKKEQGLTLIPLTIVLVFFICGTPSLIVNIIDSLNSDVWGYPGFITFMIVANFLVVLNSAVNFIIYCLLGKKFRTKLLDLCQCKYQMHRYNVVHQLIKTGTSQV